MSLPNTHIEGSVAALLSSSLQGFPESIVKKVMDIELCLQSSIPSSTKGLWTSSTTSCPQILMSKDCWNIDVPGTTQLIFSTLDTIAAAKSSGNATYSVFKRGELDLKVDPRTPIAQLVEPKATNPVSLLGLNIDCVPDDAISPPLALSEYAEPFDTSNQQLLLAPKFVHTDLHCDSADGLSLPLGPCVKLWICFPPTPKNLAIMAQADGQKAKLARIGKKLEGGIVYTTTSADAIYLPVGTLHTVFTLHGGFLIAIDFTTPASSLATSSLLAARLDQLAIPSFRNELFARFLSSVDLGLQNKKEQLALSAWIATKERVEEQEGDNREWKAQAAKIWKGFFETHGSKKVTCPCGSQGQDESLEKHFRKEHCSSKKGTLKEVSAPRTRAATKKRKGEEGAEEGAEVEKQAAKKAKK